MKKFIFLLLSISFCLQIFSEEIQVEKASADAAYLNGYYQKAAQIYEQIASETNNADVYYNLGNAYYRMDNYPKAILNYRRAQRINPQDEDIAYNLSICQSKITDKFNQPQTMFFITWVQNLIKGKSPSQWGLWGIGFFVLSLISFGGYLYGRRLIIKKIGFSFMVLFFSLFIIIQIFAYIQFNDYQNVKEIVITNVIQSYSSPSLSSQEMRKLNEGTLAIVKEDLTKGWLQIELPDKTKVWIEASKGFEYV